MKFPSRSFPTFRLPGNKNNISRSFPTFRLPGNKNNISRSFPTFRLPGKKAIIIFFALLIRIPFLPAQTNSPIFGLASPIVLEPDTTVVLLQDYFTDISGIKTVYPVKGCTVDLSPDHSRVTIINKNLATPLTELVVTYGDNDYTIPVKRSLKQKFVFSFNPENHSYQQVSLVGEMSNWNPNLLPMHQENGIWNIPLVLNPGKYQYQIVADGHWFLDPNNRDSIDNGIGGYNSLLSAGIKDPATLPHLSLAAVQSNIISLSTTNLSQNEHTVFAYWENFKLNGPNLSFSGDHIMIRIPDQAKQMERSYIRVYAYNENGSGNDVLIPLEYGNVVTATSQLNREDLQKTIMYFMMVDRFKNGDKANDNPVKDDRVLPQANYQGGDLAGIQQKIDDGYFTKMGFNALWISPVFQNPYNAYQEYPEPHRWFSGYHGYWPISLSQVDTRFGNNAQFKSLIDDAHNNNMSVYLDYVANHIHEQHPLWKQHPEWFSQLDLPDGRKNLRLWDEYRLTTWFEPYMPSFDHSNPVVAEACADSAMFWLQNFGLDGFRHDATKHIETEFWRLLTYKIKTEVEIPQQKSIYQIGETFGSRELIDSYIGSGLLDAQFDFDLYFDARSVFARDDVPFSRLSSSLQESFNYFGYHHLMGNISGNQDMARFISYASGDLKWDENDKEAGWHRDIEVTDTIGYNKLKMLLAFNFTIPGIPIVYYGDEIGMPGANDPDNRRMMQFDSLNKYQLDVKATVTKLAELRSEHMALLFGDFISLSNSDPMIWIYSRSYLNDAVVIIFNKQNKPVDISPEKGEWPDTGFHVNFGSKVTGHSIRLAPYSFEIITFE